MTELDSLPERVVEQFPITVLNVYVHRSEFVDHSDPLEPPDLEAAQDAPFTLGYAYLRPSLRRLNIAMLCKIDVPDSYVLNLSFAGEFEMHPEFPVDEIEGAWRRFASHVAPIVLYPYVREYVSSITSRGRGGSIVLPILTLGGTVDEAEIEIPSATAFAGNETEAPE